MAFLTVHLDDHAEFRVGEVDAGDQLAAVVHLELSHRLGKACAPQQLPEPSLENAANRPFTGCLAFEHGSREPTARTKITAELFPPSPECRRREPPTPLAVIDQLFEPIGVDHYAEIQDRSKRTRDRNAIELGEVYRIEVTRLVPHDVGAVAPTVPQRRHLDQAIVTVDETQKRCRRPVRNYGRPGKTSRHE